LNLFDADAAWRLVHELAADAPGRDAVAIIKHANASGAAVTASLAQAYTKALDADPLSAFGGIVALGGPVDGDLARVVAEVPRPTSSSRRTSVPRRSKLCEPWRKATRLLRAPAPEPLSLSIRTFGLTALVQEADELRAATDSWTCATSRQPTAEELVDLALAWRVCARTTSNAVVLAKDGVAVGVGAATVTSHRRPGGPPEGWRPSSGAAAASDAFFPFADGVEALIAAGVNAIVQPGGSVRDSEVVAAAEAGGVVMMMTGERHFRH
jgi:phosphoribosylaminoimidazolecarboxamide formyltransferase/IMP cyclohydrolase